MTLTIKRDFGTPVVPGAMPDVANATIDAVRAQREAKLEQARREHAGMAEPEVDDETPPREDVDSVEVELPCGIVVFGPPPGVSLTMRLATFPDAAQMRGTGYLRFLMCVRSINGKLQPPIKNIVEAQKLANLIGDRYLDYLAEIYATHWPPLTTADLPVVKKNLR